MDIIPAPGKDPASQLPIGTIVTFANHCLVLVVLGRGSRWQSVSPAVLENVTRYERRSKERGLGILASQELFPELVPLYFHYSRNIAHTIFHEPGFMRRLQDGRAFMIHVYAMCALTARYLTPGSLTISLFLTSIIANETKDTSPIEYLEITPHMPEGSSMRLRRSVVVAGACLSELGNRTRFLLIGYYFSGEGSIQEKHIYVGLARLHDNLLSPENTTTVVLREEIRRTWLSIHIASHWSASDMAIEPTNPFHGPAPLPKIDDADFHTLDPKGK